MSIIYDGKYLSDKIKSDIKSKLKNIIQDNQRPPKLAVILVGSDPASKIYVERKCKACEKIGIVSEIYKLCCKASQNKVISVIRKLNQDLTVDGILLQLPLSERLDTFECIKEINPKKDVDGLHPLNQGLLNWESEGFYPCTPLAVMEILKFYKIEIEGKHVVVVGKSVLVGSSVAKLLSHAGASVSLLHSNSVNPHLIAKKAYILISAAGSKNLIDKNWVNEKMHVIDIGINKDENGICGDVYFDQVKDIVKGLTPVPGGIGPMTIAMLLQNTFKAYKLNLKIA